MTDHHPSMIQRILFCDRGRRFAILVIAWLSLFAGINSIPVEDHEALVLQTSREMSARGDWVMPYFNQEPRLNKPPVSYWMTMAISHLDPFHSDIEPWHGRASSMLGGLLLLLFMAYAGEKLYGAETGFLIAILLLGTKGFTEFSHQARPDFLYAVLCVLQLTAWIGAWRAKDGSSSQWLRASLGWGLAGLATLTKGPQIPVIFLLGFLLFLLCSVERRRTLKVMRPFSGSLIFLAICLPWWLLLQHRLRTTGIDIAHTQLSGSLLQSLSGWKEILSFYYVFNLFDLLLPFSLLLPILMIWNRRTCGKPGDVEHILLYVAVTTLVVFTVAGHYRPHYMLPLLPLLIVLLAAWTRRTAGHSLPKMGFCVVSGIGIMALVVCAGLLLWQRQYAPLLLLSSTGVALGVLLRKEAKEPVWQDKPLCLQLIATALLSAWLFAGFNALPLRNSSREQTRNLAESLCQEVPTNDPLATWRKSIDVLPYYTRRRIDRIDNLNELREHFEQKSAEQDLYIIIPKNKITEIDRMYELSIMETKDVHRKSKTDLVCARILKARS